MFLFMQVQLLQPNLELDERLNQLQGVSSYEREWSGTMRKPEEPSTPPPTPAGPAIPVVA